MPQPTNTLSDRIMEDYWDITEVIKQNSHIQPYSHNTHQLLTIIDNIQTVLYELCAFTEMGEEKDDPYDTTINLHDTILTTLLENDSIPTIIKSTNNKTNEFWWEYILNAINYL